MRISDWSSDVCSSDLRLDIVEPSARDHRVMHMAFKRIASIQHGSDPALRPVGGATIDRTLRQHKHSLVLRQVDGGRQPRRAGTDDDNIRSEEHTSELQSLMRISYAVFCLKKNTQI